MASFGRWKIPQTRSGRRSISVGKLLEKERAGTLFKKHSSTRALREVLRELPEVAADYRAAKGTKTLAGAGAGDVLKRFGLSQAADPAALTTERVNQPLADLFKSFKGRTVPREAEARFEQASRSSWSGRHAPRPGETTIPAGVSGEMVVSNPSKDHIFRGNPVSGGDANYFSRHPEVAAGYATGQTAKQYGVPSKRLFAYENPGGGVESAADAIRPAVIPKAQAAGKLDEVVSEATAAALARQKGLNPNSPLRSYGRLVPTYETLHAGAAAQGMKPKGEYAVRPVRLGKEPGYAISDVSGAPASSIFQKHAGGRAHGVKHVIAEEAIGHLISSPSERRLERLRERRGENADGSLKHAFKLDGETTFQGLDVAIENGVGSTRKGKDADGSKWAIEYKTPYGYIRGTKGADGEELDAYVGPKKDADTAYVVHQRKDDGSYDEDTVMLGYDSKASAKADILRHYSDPKYVGSVDAISMEKLHGLVESGKKLVKISDAVGFRAHVQHDEEEKLTGIPAHLRAHPGDVPSREEVDVNPTPKTEDRQANRATVYVGGFASPGGENDVGKFAAALQTLGEMSRTWEVPTTDAGVGRDPEVSVDAARVLDHSQYRTLSEIGIGADDSKTAMVREAFLDELQKIAEAHGYPPWAGELETFERYVEDFTKEAFAGGVGGALGGVRQFAQKAIGRLRPQGGAAAMPEVQAFRKGTGFFSTGMGKDLAAGGKALSHNPQAAGAAAGLGAKDLKSLQAMRPTSAGKRVAGEVAHGAGHHIAHSHPLQLALNPIGTGMGGAIEGAARGVGKEMAGSARKGVQTAGRALQKHAPKIGLGGELVAGGFLHTPGLASAIGGAVAPAAHGVAQHVIGEGAQRLGRAIPKAIPRAAGMVGRAFA
jgi:hypothetical protein